MSLEKTPAQKLEAALREELGERVSDLRVETVQGLLRILGTARSNSVIRRISAMAESMYAGQCDNLVTVK